MSKPVRGFDYSAMDKGARDLVRGSTRKIREKDQLINGLIHQTALTAWQIGQALAEVQEKLPHGQFLAWLAAEFPDWSKSTAYNFLHVFQKLDLPTVGNLQIGLRALYQLAAPSTPEAARVEVRDRAEAGEKLTTTAVQVIVSERKEEEIREGEKYMGIAQVTIIEDPSAPKPGIVTVVGEPLPGRSVKDEPLTGQYAAYAGVHEAPLERCKRLINDLTTADRQQLILWLVNRVKEETKPGKGKRQ